MDVRDISASLKVLGEPTRIEIVNSLAQKDYCVTELLTLFPISQPAMSRHLSRLRNVNLVQEKRKGMRVYYSLNHESLKHVASYLTALSTPSQHNAY